MELSRPDNQSSFTNAAVTFVSFAVAGIIPLLPYLFHLKSSFLVSMLFGGTTLFIVGAARKLFSNRSWLISGLEMLFVGGLAGAMAYAVGFLLRHVFGV